MFIVAYFIRYLNERNRNVANNTSASHC